MIVLVEGDEDQIAEYTDVVHHSHPKDAVIATITTEPYNRNVMKLMDYAFLAHLEMLHENIPKILRACKLSEEILE